MARRDEDLGILPTNPAWKPLRTLPRPEIWTDDFSNILRVLKW
jgi:hypothetical protein